MSDGQPGQWMLLAYRIPRDPSRPRIAVWRKLERLGVARLGDGLVALPEDARTRGHFDWLAEETGEAGGTATVWLSVPSTLAQEREIAAGMRAARAAEYQAVIDEAGSATGAGQAELLRVVRRLRGELRRINRRDYFPPPHRDAARIAVQGLAEETGVHDVAGVPAWGGARPRRGAARPVDDLRRRERSWN